MDETEFTQSQYASFLVRLWRGAEAEPGSSTGEWQGEVEHIQSVRRCMFETMAGLNRIPRQLCEVSEARST